MKGKLTSYIGLISLLLFLLPSLVNAEILVNSPNIDVIFLEGSEQFQIGLESTELNLCKCTPTISYFVIKNNGNYPSKYNFETNLNYVFISQNELTLMPAESKQIFISYSVPCDKFFSDKLELKISSIFGELKLVEQKLNFKNCQNLMSSFNESPISISPCEKQILDLQIVNTGTYDEIYDIYAKGKLKEYVFTDYPSFSLSSKGVANIELELNTPCNIYGNYSLDLEITSRKSGKIIQFAKPISIERNYPFEVYSQPESINACAEYTTEAKLNIENYNSFSNEYIFKIDAPKFVTFDFPEVEGEGVANSIILSENSKTLIPIKINATKKQIGTYNIEIITKSLNGEIEKTTNIPLEVKNCYDFELNIPQNKIHLCGGDDFTQIINVKNKGTEDTTIGLVYANGPNFGSLESENVFLEANGIETNTSINFNNITNENSKIDVEVALYHNTQFQTSDWVTLNIYDTNKCYNVVSKNNNIKLNPEENSFQLIIQNKGLRDGEYRLDLIDAPEFLHLTQSTLSLNWSDKAYIDVTIDQEELQNYLDENNNGSRIGVAIWPTLLITHEATNTVFSNSMEIRFVDYSFFKYFVDYIYSLSTCTLMLYSLSILTLIALIYLIFKLIFKRKNDFKFKPKKPLLLFSIAAIVIWAILVVSIFSIPFNLPLKWDSQDTIHTYQNKIETLDMADYFYDEDGDIVEYNVEFIDNEDEVNYEFNETILTLIPEETFVGNITFTLSAEDSYGEKAESTEIILHVYETKTYQTYNELYKAYCPYMNWILLIIFLAFVFFGTAYRKLTKAEIQEIERKRKAEEKRIEKEKLKAMKEKQKAKLLKAKSSKTKKR
ncbi:MAG: hypothetical protein PHU51_02290 [Candidatus Nanoarchaeia archaeon]|nr:hypothetical protein [Candidatus Nanoarchaeia archaeon]